MSEVQHLGGTEKHRGHHSSVSGAIPAMDIMLIKTNLIVNSNMGKHQGWGGNKK